ncbi:MAG: glycerol-3-phosphate 1-O-acyltransferase PlsY [Lachnospiraceae bacterium]|nr:glycerol-3-phosphate 1-O-acyltransferase PlsY [Lachnospiraceae bacterium]
MVRVICLLIGYALGLIQTGYIIGRIKGVDIRQHGSKNAGTTNMLRTLGLKYAGMVLLGDVLKCGIAILIVNFMYKDIYPDMLPLLKVYAATGTILGHNYPFYLKFKGGKGIAATAGLVIFGFGPLMTILGIITFFGIFFITHYVSLGSIFVYVGIIIEGFILSKSGYFGQGIATTYFVEFNALLWFLAILTWWRHRVNIVNLIKGTERKTYLKGKPEIDVNEKKENKEGKNG